MLAKVGESLLLIIEVASRSSGSHLVNGSSAGIFLVSI